MLKTKLKKKSLLKALITFITKKGKKELVKKIFKTALVKASKKTNLGSHFLLANVFKKLQSSVEVKNVKRRRNFFKIPFFIRSKRQKYLSIRWFFNAVSMNKNQTNFSDKICLELVQVLKSNRAKSITLKNQNLKLAISNRSNIHYR